MQIVIDITEEDYENVSQSNFTVLTREKKAHLINRVLSKVAEGIILPEKHRKWEEEEFDLGENLPVWVGYKCSECGEYSDSKFDFCPNCGVDMRGAEK